MISENFWLDPLNDANYIDAYYLTESYLFEKWGALDYNNFTNNKALYICVDKILEIVQQYKNKNFSRIKTLCSISDKNGNPIPYKGVPFTIYNCQHDFGFEWLNSLRIEIVTTKTNNPRQAGYIPKYTTYKTIFTNAGNSIKIVDKALIMVFANNRDVLKLDKTIIKRIIMHEIKHIYNQLKTNIESIHPDVKYRDKHITKPYKNIFNLDCIDNELVTYLGYDTVEANLLSLLYVCNIDELHAYTETILCEIENSIEEINNLFDEYKLKLYTDVKARNEYFNALTDASWLHYYQNLYDKLEELSVSLPSDYNVKFTQLHCSNLSKIFNHKISDTHHLIKLFRYRIKNMLRQVDKIISDKWTEYVKTHGDEFNKFTK